jgi:hypothetical protein
MRVIVCGGRDYDNFARVCTTLDAVARKHPNGFVVVQGGAPGADGLARQWCQSRKVECVTYAADWGKHGRAAGPLRNQQMLDAGADGLVAFPGGRGTADMVKRAENAGVPVWRIA